MNASGFVSHKRNINLMVVSEEEGMNLLESSTHKYLVYSDLVIFSSSIMCHTRHTRHYRAVTGQLGICCSRHAGPRT